jgi:hypothetical protein
VNAPSYFEHVAKSTSWDVVNMDPDVTVTERQLTDDEVEAMRRQIEDANREAAWA